MKDEIVKYDSAKITKNIIIGALVLILSAYLLLKCINSYNGIYVIIGTLGTFVFLPKVIFASIVKFTQRELLIINKEGITDNSEMYSVGFIPWKDIQGIVVKGKKSQKKLEIQLKNCNKIMTEISWIKRFMLRFSKKITSSAIIVTFDYCEMSFDDAVELINKKSREYTKRKVQYIRS